MKLKLLALLFIVLGVSLPFVADWLSYLSLGFFALALVLLAI